MARKKSPAEMNSKIIRASMKTYELLNGLAIDRRSTIAEVLGEELRRGVLTRQLLVLSRQLLREFLDDIVTGRKTDDASKEISRFLNRNLVAVLARHPEKIWETL